MIFMLREKISIQALTNEFYPFWEKKYFRNDVQTRKEEWTFIWSSLKRHLEDGISTPL